MELNWEMELEVSKGLEGGLNLTESEENVKPAQMKDPTKANPEARNFLSH